VVLVAYGLVARGIALICLFTSNRNKQKWVEFPLQDSSFYLLLFEGSTMTYYVPACTLSWIVDGSWHSLAIPLEDSMRWLWGMQFGPTIDQLTLPSSSRWLYYTVHGGRYSRTHLLEPLLLLFIGMSDLNVCIHAQSCDRSTSVPRNSLPIVAAPVTGLHASHNRRRVLGWFIFIIQNDKCVVAQAIDRRCLDAHRADQCLSSY
jgi:hypothetical protein